jgi:hypothetical protein
MMVWETNVLAKAPTTKTVGSMPIEVKQTSEQYRKSPNSLQPPDIEHVLSM